MGAGVLQRPPRPLSPPAATAPAATLTAVQRAAAVARAAGATAGTATWWMGEATTAALTRASSPATAAWKARAGAVRAHRTAAKAKACCRRRQPRLAAAGPQPGQGGLRQRRRPTGAAGRQWSFVLARCWLPAGPALSPHTRTRTRVHTHTRTHAYAHIQFQCACLRLLTSTLPPPPAPRPCGLPACLLWHPVTSCAVISLPLGPYRRLACRSGRSCLCLCTGWAGLGYPLSEPLTLSLLAKP